jgi:hypothetical protein
MRSNIKILVALFIATLILTACGSGAKATPTMDANQRKTEIAMTVQVELTRVSALTPSATITPSPTMTVTPTATLSPTTGTNSPTQANPQGTVAPTININPQPTSSSDSYTLVDEEPKDTAAFKPNEVVTKKWVIKNGGNSTWDKNYKLVYLEGPLGKTNEILIGKDVAPGETITLSMVFTAPSAAGTSRSYWKMLNSSGKFFGESIWIEFRVSGS